MLDPGDGWDLCARCDPLLVGLELQAELVVEDLKIAVPAAHDRLRHDRLRFLRHHADIDLVAAVIAEAIEPKAVVQTTEKGDVVLKRNIRPPATPSASSATGRGHTGRSSATHARRSSATMGGHAGRSSATADALTAA